jgi:WD40 repeat protein
MPFERLEDAILGLAVSPVPNMAEQLGLRPDDTAEVVAGAIPERAELLLIVDQFEELFTMNTAEVQRAFMVALHSLATSTANRHAKVVVTMRADFFDRPLATHAFGDLLRKGVVMVTALSAEGLRAAIMSPAKNAGVKLEPGLADDIIADVNDQPGGLPLMEYALTRLFEQRDAGVLSAAAYHKFGGVLGALGRRAEDCFATLDDDGRQAVRQIMLRLVAVSDSGDDARQRTSLAELAGLAREQATIGSVLTLYGDNRLLTFDRDPRTREPTVEVAHEALLSRWDRLRTWTEDRRDDLLDRRRLGEAVREWNDAHRAPEYLLAGGRLAHFETWAAETDLSLTDDERALLAASRHRVDATATRQTRRRRLIVAGFAVIALLAMGLALVASANQQSAERQAAVSRARELTAAALDALDEDQQLSLLLALEAAQVGRTSTGSVLPQTLDALHQVIGATRIESVIPLDGLPEGRGVGMAMHDTGLVAVASTGDVVELRRVDDPATIVATLGTAREGVEVGNDAVPAFDPSGNLLAVTASDGTVRVWDVATQTEIWSAPTETGGPRDAMFSGDGETLVTTGDTSVTMWESASGTEIWTVEIVEPSMPAFSPDGSRLAVGSWFGRSLHILDAATGEELLSQPIGFGVDGLLWTPDGSRLLLGIEPGDIVVLDAVSLERIDVWPGHGASPSAMAVDEAAQLLASGGDDGTARVWALDTGTELLELTGHEGNVGAVALFGDGTHLVTVGSDRTLRRYDISAAGPGEVFAASTTGAQAFGIDLDPGGDLLIAHALEGDLVPAGVVMWELGNGQEVLRIDGLDWFPFGGVSFTPDGSAFVAQDWDEAGAEQMGDDAFEVLTGPQWGPIQLRDVPTGEPLLEFEASAGSDRQTLVFDANGSLLAGGGSDDSGTGVLSTASVWDAATGRLLHRLDHDDFAVAAVALTADGSQLATATCEIGWVTLWDLASESMLWRVDYPGCSTRVAVSAVGGFVVATSLDNPPTVWELGSGDVRFEIEAHGEGGFAVDVSSDGSLIVSGGNDGSVVFVDSATAEVVNRIQVGDTAIGAVAFSGDDRHLAVATLDGLAFVYTLDSDELVAIAQSRVLRTLTGDECAAYRIESCTVGR